MLHGDSVCKEAHVPLRLEDFCVVGAAPIESLRMASGDRQDLASEDNVRLRGPLDGMVTVPTMTWPRMMARD